MLTLYKVGANGRISLGDNVKEGEHYTLELGHDDEGADTITLTRVDIVTPTTKRAVEGRDDTSFV